MDPASDPVVFVELVNIFFEVRRGKDGRAHGKFRDRVLGARHGVVPKGEE